MNFDLNINNYKKNELTEMFDLPPNYGRDLVDIKETKLRESILNNKEIKNYLLDKKSAIFEFVNIESIKKIYNKKNKENYLSKFLFNFINAKIFLDKNL